MQFQRLPDEADLSARKPNVGKCCCCFCAWVILCVLPVLVGCVIVFALGIVFVVPLSANSLVESYNEAVDKWTHHARENYYQFLASHPSLLTVTSVDFQKLPDVSTTGFSPANGSFGIEIAVTGEEPGWMVTKTEAQPESFVPCYLRIAPFAVQFDGNFQDEPTEFSPVADSPALQLEISHPEGTVTVTNDLFLNAGSTYSTTTCINSLCKYPRDYCEDAGGHYVRSDSGRPSFSSSSNCLWWYRLSRACLVMETKEGTDSVEFTPCWNFAFGRRSLLEDQNGFWESIDSDSQVYTSEWDMEIEVRSPDDPIIQFARLTGGRFDFSAKEWTSKRTAGVVMIAFGFIGTLICCIVGVLSVPCCSVSMLRRTSNSAINVGPPPVVTVSGMPVPYQQAPTVMPPVYSSATPLMQEPVQPAPPGFRVVPGTAFPAPAQDTSLGVKGGIPDAPVY